MKPCARTWESARGTTPSTPMIVTSASAEWKPFTRRWPMAWTILRGSPYCIPARKRCHEAAGDSRLSQNRTASQERLGHGFFIPEQTFLRQLRELQAGGWQVVDLATCLHGLSSPDFLPERSALITFDDGYRSMLTITLPLLQRLGLPSVLFVPTDNVGKSNSFDSGLEPDEMLCDCEGEPINVLVRLVACAILLSAVYGVREYTKVG